MKKVNEMSRTKKNDKTWKGRHLLYPFRVGLLEV